LISVHLARARNREELGARGAVRTVNWRHPDWDGSAVASEPRRSSPAPVANEVGSRTASEDPPHVSDRFPLLLVPFVLYNGAAGLPPSTDRGDPPPSDRSMPVSLGDALVALPCSAYPEVLKAAVCRKGAMDNARVLLVVGMGAELTLGRRRRHPRSCSRPCWLSIR
jgi:hypothetical protein